MSAQPELSTFRRTESLNDLQQLLCDVSKISSDDRRGSHRINRSLVLAVQPLDTERKPIGKPLKALTRDISADGLGFIHPTPFPTEFVEIRNVENSHSYAVARVCYNRAYCDDDLNYFVGVQFVTDNR